MGWTYTRSKFDISNESVWVDLSSNWSNAPRSAIIKRLRSTVQKLIPCSPRNCQRLTCTDEPLSSNLISLNTSAFAGNQTYPACGVSFSSLEYEWWSYFIQGMSSISLWNVHWRTDKEYGALLVVIFISGFLEAFAMEIFCME